MIHHGAYTEVPATYNYIYIRMYIANGWIYVWVYTLNVRDNHGCVQKCLVNSFQDFEWHMMRS